MGYIYCITNTINNKKYVGKTLKTVEKRFTEHIIDSRKRRMEKRPLYRAINKYGSENFTVTVLEEVLDDTLLSSRELFWIDKLNTYKQGYNATKGGDGKQLFDHERIISLIKEGYTYKQIQNIVGCSFSLVNQIKTNNNLQVRNHLAKIIGKFSIEDDILLGTYFGGTEAAKSLPKIDKSLDTIGTIILRHCKTLTPVYGFIWKFLPYPEYP